MTEIYPDHPNLRGNYAPLRMECNINDLIIEGEVPKELLEAITEMAPIHNFHPWEEIIIGLQETVWFMPSILKMEKCPI